MAFFYPRKQTVMIFAICIIAVGGTLYFTNTGSFKPDNTTDDSLKVNAGAVKNELVQKLSDSLNSVDWKSQFFNMATTSDNQKTGTDKATTSYTDPDTITDSFSKAFFTKYVQLRQAGLSGNNETVQSAMEQVVQNSLTSVPAPRFFTIADIKISKNNTSKTSLEEYSTNLYTLLKDNLPKPDVNEIYIAQEAMDKGNMDLLGKIDPIINGYKYAESGMMSMTVPEPLAQYHLNLLNAISLQLSNAESMRKSDTDPIRALSAVSTEVTSLENLAFAISKIQSYLGATGIIFAK